MSQADFKVGDVVVCLPGFIKGDNTPNRGGAGYKEGLIFKISHFSSKTICWPKEGCGLYIQSLRLATEEEKNWHFLDPKRNQNIHGMISIPMKKYSIHYIDSNGEKAVAEVDDIKEVKDLKEFLYKFER